MLGGGGDARLLLRRDEVGAQLGDDVRARAVGALVLVVEVAGLR